MIFTRQRSLRSYLFALAAVTLVPALGVGAGTAYFMYADLRHGFEARLDEAADALALAVDRHIATRRAVLDTLGKAAELDRASSDDPDSMGRLYETARRSAETLGDPISLFLPNQVAFRTSEPLGSTPRPVIAAKDLQRAFATGKPVVGNLHLEPHPIVPLLVPVVRAGRVVAVLGTRVGLQPLMDLLNAARPANAIFVSVVDADGRVVAVVPHATNNPALGQRVRDWQRKLIDDHPGGGFGHGTSLLGVPVVAAVHPIPSARGWAVTVAAPKSTYAALFHRPLFWLALSGGMVLLVSLAGAALLARRLVEPVRALTRHAEQLAQGVAFADTTPIGPIPVTEVETLWAAIRRANATLAEHADSARQSEARFRALIDTAMDAIIVIDESSAIHHFNRGAERIFGWSAAEVLGRKLDMLMAKDAAAQHRSYVDRYLVTGQRRLMGSLGEVTGKRRDGSLVPLETTLGQWRDAAGRRFFAGILRDISDRKQAQERQALLAREVDHRSKNLLAVVQSVMRMSRAETIGEFVTAVTTRINALARAHSLLAKAGWEGADLRVVAERELAAYADRVVLHGPPIHLAATAVQPAAIVLHELATNALKYGALAAEAGRVELSWRIDAVAGTLDLRWQETGGASPAERPTRRGFGTRVIDATVAQLGGTVRRRWPPSGLVCEVRVLLQRVLRSGEQQRAA